jgi:membrane protein
MILPQVNTMRAKQYLGLLKQAASSWSSDYAPSMGAAISYYTLFSIAPLLLIVIAVAGLVFGADAARGAIFGQLEGLMGGEGAKAVEGLLQAANQPREGMIASIVGVVVLLIGATTVFGELQNALDRIWRAPAREESSGWWTLIRTRLLSFGMILGIAFLLMVSLVMSATLAALGKLWAFEGWEALTHALDIVVSFGLVTVLFALIYKIIPRVHVSWHDVWIGAAVTSLLFAVGKFLIGLYLGKSALASSFGAAGSLVVVMVWVYYSAQIFLFGAEFTWVYAHEFGSRRGQPRPGTEADKVEAKPQAPREPEPALALAPITRTPSAPYPVFDQMPGTRRKHPLALLAGALAIGAVLGLSRATIADALERRSPLFSRRRRIFGALGH